MRRRWVYACQHVHPGEDRLLCLLALATESVSEIKISAGYRRRRRVEDTVRGRLGVPNCNCRFVVRLPVRSGAAVSAYAASATYLKK